jgi:hypothetical protein
VRRLEVHSSDPDYYEIRCSDCDWVYRINHRSPVVNELEESLAAREFTIHRCADFTHAKGQTN